MNSSDRINIEGDRTEEYRRSASNAEAKRCAILHEFATKCGLGKTPWHLDDSGRWVGNPANADSVIGYIYSLRRRKVRAGEGPKSSKAMTPDVLKAMFEYIRQNGRTDCKAYQEKLKNRKDRKGSDEWATPLIRIQTFAYTLMGFTCLLRTEEVNGIRLGDLKFFPRDGATPPSVEINLRHRKSDQFVKSKDKPFRVYKLTEDKAHLCLVGALSAYIAATRFDDKKPNAPLFRKLKAFDRVTEEALPSAMYLDWLRCHLSEIGVEDAALFGTHCLRRGGCQYYFLYLHWSILRIAAWGGWSVRGTYKTIITYLIGLIDDELIPREDFLNPTKNYRRWCDTCHRTCACDIY
ncbi:hypothetical protein B0H11DRAFT_1737189 [Mycena galericulata]|nr:hypothetical protein B0H11DRAFT_1737189 [Mycena galericulata]